MEVLLEFFLSTPPFTLGACRVMSSVILFRVSEAHKSSSIATAFKNYYIRYLAFMCSFDRTYVSTSSRLVHLKGRGHPVDILRSPPGRESLPLL